MTHRVNILSINLLFKSHLSSTDIPFLFNIAANDVMMTL